MKHTGKNKKNSSKSIAIKIAKHSKPNAIEKAKRHLTRKETRTTKPRNPDYEDQNLPEQNQFDNSLKLINNVDDIQSDNNSIDGDCRAGNFRNNEVDDIQSDNNSIAGDRRAENFLEDYMPDTQDGNANTEELYDEKKNEPSKAAEKKFVRKAWKTEMSKDIEALTKKYDGVIREIKDIKGILKHVVQTNGSKRSFSPPLTSDEEFEDFPLLPQLPLRKRKQVKKMQENILANQEYKKQLVSFMEVVRTPISHNGKVKLRLI